MGRAQSSAGVAVKILEELNIVAKVRVVLKFVALSEHGSTAQRIAQEDSRQAVRQIAGHLIDRAMHARAARAFDEEFVPVVVMELLQRFNDQKVHGKPDGP